MLGLEQLSGVVRTNEVILVVASQFLLHVSFQVDFVWVFLLNFIKNVKYLHQVSPWRADVMGICVVSVNVNEIGLKDINKIVPVNYSVFYILLKSR